MAGVQFANAAPHSQPTVLYCPWQYARDPENCVTGQKKSFVQDIVAPVTSADDIIGACESSCPHQTLEQSDVGRTVTPLALDGYFCFSDTGWQLFP